MPWFGRSLVLLLVLLAWTPLLSSCAKIPSFLTGGGPNVAANVQAGRENRQVVGVSSEIAPRATVRPQGRVDHLDQRVTHTNEVDPLVWVFLGFIFVAWSYFLYILPSPDQIWKKKT